MARLKIYSDDKYKRYFSKRVRTQHVRPATIDIVTRGVIVNRGRGGYGVYDADGRLVNSSRQYRGRDSQIVHSHIRLPRDVPFVDADVMFLGVVYPQFGHFLLEHMNRAWGLLHDECRGRRVVLVNPRGADVPEYMYRLIEMMGVKRSDIIILRETTRFRSVAVPSQGFNIALWANDEDVRAYEYIASNVAAPKKTYEKIYVSRDAMSSRRTFGEGAIQKIFAKNGFHIIRPETLPLEQQIALMRGCRVLAGCAGTALHLALFMPRGGTVIQIKRNTKPKCNADTQYLINTIKNHDSVFVSGSMERARTNHGDNAPQIIGMTPDMRRFFDENGFKYTAADLRPDLVGRAEYDDALAKYNAQHGSVGINRLKHAFVHFSACLIPGRELRGRYRSRMKRVLHAV